MKYSLKFKHEVFRIAKFTGRLTPLIKAIENNEHNSVRLILEQLVDDENLYNFRIKEDGEIAKRVKTNKKYAYKVRLSIYSRFMDMYIEHLDVMQGERVTV